MERVTRLLRLKARLRGNTITGVITALLGQRVVQHGVVAAASDGCRAAKVAAEGTSGIGAVVGAAERPAGTHH